MFGVPAVLFSAGPTKRGRAESAKGCRVQPGVECTALTGPTLRDRLHVAMLLVRHAGRALRRLPASPRRLVGRWRARRIADRLLIAPQDIRTADPTIAADIGAGYFAFGGRIVNAAGRSPFAPDPARSDSALHHQGGGEAGADRAGSDAWMRQLAGFGWLRHLRAADGPALRARGRELVDDFLIVAGKPRPTPAWESAVVARRLLSWLSQSPVILAGADRGFYFRFVRALERHATELEARLAGGLSGTDRLLVALALAEYGLCIESSPARQKRGTDALAGEIAAQLLPDGGHVSRNPQVLIDLLLDLLPLRQAYAARTLVPPLPVLNAVDRMIPMLRLLRHGDGTLALFNGMGRTAPELVATILAYDDGRARSPVAARYAGYQRLEAGGAVVVVDAGGPPPQPFSTRAHAGALAFELSTGPRRLVINCGTAEGGRTGVQQAARATAAHSTLVLADTSSCRFAAQTGVQRYLGGAILAGPSAVTVERMREEAATRLELSHNGYAGRFGLVHRRTLTLADDGDRLDGCDALAEADGSRGAGKVEGSTAFALRFHLHPAVKARPQAASSPERSSVRLDMPDGESWVFEADAPGATLGVEPSILFAAAGGPRAASQIVVTADTGRTREIRWSFRQLVPPFRAGPR